MEITRTFDLLERYRQHFNKPDVFVSKVGGKWRPFSTDEYLEYSASFSLGMLAMGFGKGDRVATITTNRPEWNFIDMGLTMAGIIHVPIFSTLSLREFNHILRHAGVSLLIFGDKQLYSKLGNEASSILQEDRIFSFNPIPGVRCWTEILELGRKQGPELTGFLEKTRNEITPDDPAVLIYTSGTTGPSKGVLLSHRNLVSNFLAAANVFRLKSEYRYLSILPLCHVGGRLGNYQTQYSGTTIYYAENLGTIAENMREIRPEGFDAVPRILEKIFNTILQKGNKLTGFKKRIFFWSIALGLKYRPDGNNPWHYRIRHRLADKLIFSKWREAIGGKIQLVGCGGAALQPRIERIFWAAGVKVINMYGLTETSPIITINRASSPDLLLGSVGSVIPGVEIKIAADGEILCKGPNVMLGYYGDDQATTQANDAEGWFHTGDIGEIVKGRFLMVTDRKKEVFKLANGKFVSPQEIENRLKESAFIDQAFVFGEGEKFASALIAPNFQLLAEWCANRGCRHQQTGRMINNPKVLQHYQEIINKFNRHLEEFQYIKRFQLVEDEWSPHSGELSHTLKLKRKFILEKYVKVIDQIYSVSRTI
ncbi:MAG TPA: long-chain fatty acid--CoA ligase [Bacteroidales bacterium]|nr:long-chain fatty acid--CoA ligase [Bacteroidales bacterium]